MEGRVLNANKLAPIVLLALALQVFAPAFAQFKASDPCGQSPLSRDSATYVWTDQGTGSAYVQSQAACQSGPVPAAATAPPPACVLWDVGPATQQFGPAIGDLVGASTRQGQQPEVGPPTVPMVQMCGGTPTGIVWVLAPCPAGTCPPATVPQATLVELLDRIPMPAVTIAVSPSQAVGGITGLPSQFWAVGYDGSPIQWSGPTAGGGRVDLVGTLRAFVWDFGDGTRLTTAGPGSPWPQPAGAITHMYTIKSADAGFATGPLATDPGAGGYPLSLRVTFDVRYRLNGGPWQAGLPPIDRVVSDHYPVYEVRSRLVG